MTKTNVERGKENAQKLRQYIEQNDTFPLYQGRLNKRKLVLELGLGEAALQNEDIKEQLNQLAVKIAQGNNKKLHQRRIGDDNSHTISQLRKLVDSLTKKLALSEAKLDEYRRAEISHSHLIKTGKFIRQKSESEE
ncbi:hypothetical protein [Vibrio parahaemolyticus]|uniref:hypothetical protein n=1 Tax=Vibrio parahaemolyticus TaxID=670 RepID=UPI00084AD5C8|nr:hypothetical protein [Vibrio parahaemolyticus]EGQ7856011.1 hypothetical protein [Vibrio parahaemolyticus]EGR2249983.1 hypothetical protein [Vibrio parahaemolyticus]MDF4713745.1 hypothetical protein [Vibrio parahaemolyticus]ODX85160.1 hypothetical protein BBM92_14250 [Vibrio parahaemolyticus]ODY08698.1 hypothetical protein BBM15_21125 [Vibrio parahaemolyticus]